MEDKRIKLKNLPVVEVEFSKIKPNGYNPKKDVKDDDFNGKQYAKVVKSLKNIGYDDKISVREVDGDYVIIDGFHRWKAFQELGWDTGKIEVTNYGKITEAEAKAITFAKETKIPTDEIMLSELLKEMKEKGELQGAVLDYMPIELEEIDAKIELIEYSFEDLVTDKGEKETNDGEKKEKKGAEVIVFFNNREDAVLFTSELEANGHTSYKIVG